jgi:hypothetical protein
MGLDFGRGKVLWSQLDLEDHATLEPAAQHLARQVINYANYAPFAYSRRSRLHRSRSGQRAAAIAGSAVPE